MHISYPQSSPEASQRSSAREPLATRSISRSIRDRLLRQSFFPGRVLAVFEEVCDLVFPGGDVLALVTPRIGDGPLNVVVDAEARAFSSVEPGMPARLDRARLRVGDLEIGLNAADPWEPRPDWEGLRQRQNVIAARLPALRALCLGQVAPEEGGLLALLETDRFQRGVPAASRRAADALRAGWTSDQAQLEEGAVQLAGLGNGLTPSGDDFLVGAMLRAWVAHPAPERFCRALVEAAAPRTTTLSAAFLRAAARGECGEAWHVLLAALSRRGDAKLPEALQGVLAHGATSGADALAGLLWAGMAG